LPSSGVLPFLRTYACELNYSCSTTPRYNPSLDIQLTNLSVQALNILNQNDTIQSFGQLIYFVESLLKDNQTKLTQRDQIMRLVNNLNPTTMGYNPGIIDLITKMNFNFENIIQLLKQPSLFGIFFNPLLNNVTLMQNTFNSFQILQNVSNLLKLYIIFFAINLFQKFYRNSIKFFLNLHFPILKSNLLKLKILSFQLFKFIL
jgi:hypothetical protein